MEGRRAEFYDKVVGTENLCLSAAAGLLPARDRQYGQQCFVRGLLFTSPHSVDCKWLRSSLANARDHAPVISSPAR